MKVLTISDAVAAADLHVACFPDPWPAEAFTTLLNTGAFGFAEPAEVGLAGLILVRGAADEAEILTFAVRPAARRQGIGARLLLQAIAGCRAASIEKLFLEVAEDNIAGYTLYERLGFEQIGSRAGYYNAGTNSVTALIMAMRIEPV